MFLSATPPLPQVGKPTALVMINGGLISIDSLNDTAKAILVAFAPGTHGAQAVAYVEAGRPEGGGKMGRCKSRRVELSC